MTHPPVSLSLSLVVLSLLTAACGPGHLATAVAPPPALTVPLLAAAPPGSPAADSAERTRLWSWMEAPGSAKAVDLAALRESAVLGGDPTAVLGAAADWIALAAQENPDPCDRTFASRRRLELRRLRGVLEEGGRPDLAMFGVIRDLVVAGRVDPAAVEALVAWVEVPAHRWLRREVLGRGLGRLSRRVDWVDPLVTVPLCAPYYADLTAEVDTDRGDGVHGRNATRLVAAWAAAGACLDRTPVRVLTDRVISAAAAGGTEPMGVIEALGGLAGEIALVTLEGQGGDLAALLEEVAAGLRRAREGLGNQRQDRILHATLGVFAGAAELFRGRADLALQEVGTAADLLDHLAATPAAPDASEIERLAPALRGGSLVALVLLQWITDQAGLAVGTLQRLDGTLEGDLSALFQVLEIPDHSAGITRIVRGIAKAIARDWPGAAAALEEATIPTPGEAGWWAVGLDAGRMIGWDLLAILSWDEARPVARSALGRAEVVARRLVDDALAHFQVRGTGWELLTVIPLAHQVVPGFLEDTTDWPVVLKELARAVEPALETALARVEPRGDRAPGFTDLLLDVLRDATEVGLDTLVDQGKGALPRLADLLGVRQEAYRGELRFLLGMLTGAARFFSNSEAASEGLQKISEQAPESLAGVAWMPLLLDAVLSLQVKEDPAAALATLDKVIARGERAASCNVDAPVHALLPARMWLREVTGDGAGAVADYEIFRRMTARGFPGYASLACRLNSQRGSLTVNAQVGQSLAALFLPAGNEGSFNVGAGWTSVPQHLDDVACWAAVAAGPRDDAILHAHLAAALYALRRGDDPGAQSALVDAIAAGRRLLNGEAPILGPAGAATVEAARKAVSLELLAWVTFVARIRGHISAADHLADQAAWLLANRKTTWDAVLEPVPVPPVFLARLEGLDALGPHVRAWHVAADHAGKAAAMKALAEDRTLKKQGLLPPWGIRVVLELQQISAASAAGQPMPALSAPPKDPHGHAVVAAWTWIVGLWSVPASLSLQDFIVHADALAAAGLYREIVGIAATVVALTRGTPLDGMGKAVLAAAVDRIPRETFPVTRAAVLSELAPSLMQSGDLRLALVAFKDLVPALSGRIPQRVELEHRLSLVNLLGAAELVPDLTAEVRALLPMLARRFGRTEEVFHSLLSVDVALRVFQATDVPPDAAIAALVAAADDVKGAAPAKQFFRLLAAAPDPAARRELAVVYLRFMFLNGPPLQEPATEPAEPKAPGPAAGA